MPDFESPSFNERCVELRFTDGEICIYASKRGLRKLSEFCLQLAGYLDSGSEDHVHLEDYELLTPDSLPGVIAGFRDLDHEI